MAEPILQRLREPLPMTLAILAAIGWLGLIIVWIWALSIERSFEGRLAEVETERGALVAELEAQAESAASVAELSERIAELEQSRETLLTQRAAAEAELQTELVRLEEVQSALTERSEALAAAEAEFDRVGAGLAEAEQVLAETSQNLTARSNELSEVGGRLEAARADEAQLREIIAQLSDEASVTSQQIADMEQRLQQARETEAAARAQVEQMHSLEAQLAERRTFTEGEIAELEQRRNALAAEVSGAESERDRLQAQVTELAATLSVRSSERADLEADIQSLQAELQALVEEQARAQEEARLWAEEQARAQAEAEALQQQAEGDDQQEGGASRLPQLPLQQPVGGTIGEPAMDGTGATGETQGARTTEAGPAEDAQRDAADPSRADAEENVRALIGIRIPGFDMGQPASVPAGSIVGHALYTADEVELGQVLDLVRADDVLYLLLGPGSPLSGGAESVVLPLEKAVLVGDRLVFAGLSPEEINALMRFDGESAERVSPEQEVPLGAR